MTLGLPVLQETGGAPPETCAAPEAPSEAPSGGGFEDWRWHLRNRITCR